MDRLEVHTLLNQKDIELYLNTIKLFKFYSKLDFTCYVHEDGSFTDKDITKITLALPDVNIILRTTAEIKIKTALEQYPLCSHFRFSEHHTIFKIKLFDPFIITQSNNVLNLDSDILFCKEPKELISYIFNKEGFYLKDSWSAYCVPFRDEDHMKNSVNRYINAGLTYFPTKIHFNLEYIEECLRILYKHGSRDATHPFLEQTCIAYLITRLNSNNVRFHQLTHPEYCVPTFGKFLKDHNLTALHINSSPLVGKYRKEHYTYELDKLKS